MSSRIDEIRATNRVEKTSKTKKKESDVQVFTPKTSSSAPNSADWDITHYETIKKWGAKPYKWTSIVDTNDAIEKSQKSLLDMLRYYEGDRKNNYKAKQRFIDLDGKGTTTFGYGITQLPKKLGKLTTPKNDKEAYDVLMLYLDKVSYEETKGKFKKEWNKFPQSLREALIDFNFNKGTSILNKRVEDIKKAFNNNDWATLLKKLVYVYPGATKAEKVEEAGLHRRSLSRAILAVRDVKHTPEINKAIEEIYLKARACAIKQGEAVTEIDKIYNAYVNNGKIIEKPVSTEKNVKVYNINEKISVYSLALSLRPLGQKTDCLKVIIDEIIKLNNIKVEEQDANGFPKCRSIENEAIKLPKSIKLNGQIVHLNTPTKYKETVETNVVVPDAIPVAKADTVENKPVTNDSTTIATPENTTSKKQKTIGFFEFTKTLVQLSLIKIRQGVKEILSGDDNSESKEDSIVDDFDYTKPPFERLLHSKNTTIEQDGDLQIITTKYKVKKGDGVWRLAQTYDLNETSFCDLNKITDRDKINIDQILNIQKIGYKVKKGDNLSKIAEKFGITKEIIREINNLYDENKINENQTLILPGYTHIVKKEDTLYSLAKEANISVAQLKKINGLTSDTLEVGSCLKILYNYSDFGVKEEQKLENIKESGEAITSPTEKANLETRKYIKEPRIVNGKILANRAVLKPTGRGALNNKTIVINAGHGYTALDKQKRPLKDVGTEGLNGLNDEWIINYDNSMKLAERLCKQGATVIFLQGEVTLIGKELYKEKTKADMFISIHVNDLAKKNWKKGIPPVDRTQIYHTNSRKMSKKLATIMINKFKTNTDQKSAQIMAANYYVIRLAEQRLGIPAVLWEVAFMCSPDGRERLKNDKLMNQYSNQMASSIIEYFS